MIFLDNLSKFVSPKIISTEGGIYNQPYVEIPHILHYFGGPISTEGSRRVVEEYFLFPRKIGEQWVRGLQRVVQVCSHKRRVINTMYRDDLGKMIDDEYMEECWENARLAN